MTQGVVVDFSAQIARFTSGIDKMTNDLNKFQSHSSRVSANIGNAFAMLGVGISAAGLTSFIKSNIDAADALNDMSIRLGISVKDLASFKLAAEQSGTSLEGVGAGMARLTRSIGDAENGNKALAASLKTLGVTARDPKEAFFQLADAVKRIQDPAQRATLLNDVLGRSYQDLIPLLNEGGESLRKTARETEGFSDTMARMAPEADRFNDQLAAMKLNSAGIASSFVSDLLPGLNQIMEAMREAAKESGLLNAVWVGLGGIGAAMFTDDLMDRQSKILKDMVSLRAMTESSLPEHAKTKSREKLAMLQQELDGINKVNSAEKERAKTSAALKRFTETESGIAPKEQAKKIDESLAKFRALQKFMDQEGGFQDEPLPPDILDQLFNDQMAWSVKQKIIYADMAAAATLKENALQVQQKYMAAIGEETEALLDKAIASEEENARIGLTTVQLAGLTGKRHDEQIALKTADADRLRGIEGREAEVFLIEQQVEALKKLKKAEVTRPALQAQAEAWRNFSRDIESSLTDALMRGFENGNDFGENFVESLKNTLKTAALKIVVQAIVDPVMGGMQSVFQGSASGGGAMGYLNAGQTIWNGFSGGMASNLGSMAMSAGEMFGSAALTEFGVGATYAGAGGTIAGASAGSAMAGMGATVATAMPYVAAGLALYSLFGGSNGTPTRNLGNAAMQFSPQGAVTGQQTYFGGSSSSVDAQIMGMQTSYMQAAMALGIGTAATNFRFGANTGNNDQNPQFALGGGAGGISFYQSETPTSDAAVQLAASRAVFAALQGSELPGYLSKLFDGLTASSLTQEQISNTLAFAQSIKTLRDGLIETRTPLEIATAQMTDLTAEFHTSAATFKQDFISAIDAGITPTTIERWQQLGQAIDQVTQATAAATAATLAAAQTVYGTAKTNLLDAYNRESDAAKQLADNMRAFATSFTALRTSLNLGALSTLSPEAKYLEAKRQFEDVSRRAQLGDEAALGELENVSQSFLQSSRDYNASSEIYARDFAAVSAALESSAGMAARQANIAAQQVTLLQSQLSALALINTSVLSIADALSAYNAARNSLSTAASAAGNVAINALNPAGGSSIADLYQINLGRAPDAAGAAYWSERFGSSIDALEAQQFAIAAMPEYLASHKLPGYADGSNIIPFDHVAMVHRGEEIKPAAYVDKDRADRAETNTLLREVIAELRADKVQRGSAATATLTKLEIVADKLDGNKRELARTA